MKAVLPLLFFGSAMVFGQGGLVDQISLVKELMPNSSRMGFIYNPDTSTNLDQELAVMAGKTGIRVYKTPISGIREVSQAMRGLSQHDVDFIYMVEDRIVTSGNAIKFVVKSTVKKNIPVFTNSDKGTSSGAYGDFFQDGGTWKLRINGKVKERFEFTIPEGNGNFIVEE